MRGFMKGFTPCLMRAPIVFAATIFAYEKCMEAMQPMNYI
jgi:hypothetical protein